VGPHQARPGDPARRVAPGRLYEQIGVGYRRHRTTDPRVAARIVGALGDADRVVNVGAGAGSYEPAGPRVVAVEPSPVMIAQRPPGLAPVVRGVAEALPFPDQSFDVALAVLTVQHWTEPTAGLEELRRVAARQVVLHFEPGFSYWLTDRYFPEIADAEVRRVPDVTTVADALGGAAVLPVAVPHDCVDGFLAAYWRRPEAYLDRSVRDSISMFARLPDDALRDGLARLDADLRSGAWHDEHAALLDREELDAGYRLLVAG